MKLNVKRILFACICVCAIFVLCWWRMPLYVQTNINSLVNIDTGLNWPVNELTTKFSNVVNIVIKSEDLDNAKTVAGNITNVLSTPEFHNISIINSDISLSDIVTELGAHKNSFLGYDYRKLLQRGDFQKITNNAVATISGSMTPGILSVKEDPFLLTTNYVSELKTANGKWGLRDGFLWQYNMPNHYILISANVNTTDTNQLVQDVNALSVVVKKYSAPGVQIMTSGVPMHTANMTQTSKIQLSVFSFLAIAMAVLLNWLLFRKNTTLIPVVLSLAFGFLAGSVALFLCFAQPHILTFVFGVTLIGLGVDYSFHFISALIHKNQKNVYRNIFHSFLTTVVCFLPLMFSGLALLQQISVFTITGLTAIYLGWLIFMPNKIAAKETHISIPKSVPSKYRNCFLCIIIAAICATLPFVKTQNNMSQLYRPNAELLQAETELQKLSGINTSKFLIMRGKDLNDVLGVSESIKNESGNFFDLSSVLPSQERQTENQNLIRELYKSQSKKIKYELGLRTTPKFVNTPNIQISDIQNSKIISSIFDKFVFDDGKFVYLVANVANDFSTNNPAAITVSPAQQMTDLMKQYSNESYVLLTACGIALILLLLVLYGKSAFIYLTPPILASGLTISILTWFNQPITFFHLLSLFIVIGLTLDYSIFHINAVDNREIKPVLFSFLTSLFGFGILGFASFFLIHSMGITLGIGLALGYIISLFLFRNQQ